MVSRGQLLVPPTAHEIRAIDLRKVRDAQKPDFQGNKIPAGATDGSVVWSRLDHVPVMGRLVVMQRHKGMASNYDGQSTPQPGARSSPVRAAGFPTKREQAAVGLLRLETGA
ncbi:MAG: hypothetical protein ABSA70_10020 [Terriglobia bacterium]